MIKKYEQNMSYVCPECGMVTTRFFSPFVFSGRDRLSVLCPNPMCGAVCLTMFDKRSRYDITIDCPVCGDLHSQSFRRADMWNTKLLSISCAETGIDICFIGEKEELQKAIRNAQAEYAEMSASMMDYYQNYVPQSGDKALGAQISYISDILHCLSDEDSLSCRCGSHSVSITVIDDKLRLRCTKCGRMSTIEPTDEFLKSIASTGSYIFNK